MGLPSPLQLQRIVLCTGGALGGRVGGAQPHCTSFRFFRRWRRVGVGMGWSAFGDVLTLISAEEKAIQFNQGSFSE
jgi:hypothetical protein